MFLVPAVAALHTRQRAVSAVTGLTPIKMHGAWVVVIITSTLLIGYRFQVGGDWGNYIRILNDIRGLNWSDVFARGDPGYRLLNWFSLRMGWGIFGVNLIGGAIFSIGLAVFCLSLRRSWLALAVAVPYLVIVVGMGYSRQGIALGLAMLGLVALGRKSLPQYLFCVVLGATFHKSAVLLLPIAALAASRNRWLTAVWVGVVTLGAYFLLLETDVEVLYQNYVEAEIQSQGALIRLVMNALPATILLLWHKRFPFNESDARIWLWFAIISIVLFGIFMITPASTAVDRIGLYMLPLQLAVFSHLPNALGRNRRDHEFLTAAVLTYYAAVQFVWLNYATHAHAWLPYRFYPLEIGS